MGLGRNCSTRSTSYHRALNQPARDKEKPIFRGHWSPKKVHSRAQTNALRQLKLAADCTVLYNCHCVTGCDFEETRRRFRSKQVDENMLPLFTFPGPRYPRHKQGLNADRTIHPRLHRGFEHQLSLVRATDQRLRGVICPETRRRNAMDTAACFHKGSDATSGKRTPRGSRPWLRHVTNLCTTESFSVVETYY